MGLDFRSLTFQLRKLKERSKTEVNLRRTGAAEKRSKLNKGRSLWYKESAAQNQVEKGVGDREKCFEEMVAQVKRSTTEGREDTSDSDCEKYFSDD